jgi:broad specificity phosphatase PhoE
MKSIYLIRHGETAANKEGIFRGRNQDPLSENGIAQARDLGRYFEKITVEKVFSSPLYRAVQTAEIVFPQNWVLAADRINGLDFGDWTGVPKKEIQKNEPENWELWATTPEKLQFPGGETFDDLYSRARSFLDELGEMDFATAAVISHRSVLKAMLASAAGIEQNYYWRFHLDNASISRLIYDPARGYTIASLNYTDHLSDFVFEWS